jgi:hypothetical protein
MMLHCDLNLRENYCEAGIEWDSGRRSIVSTWQAFFLGLTVAWTPALVWLAFILTSDAARLRD